MVGWERAVEGSRYFDTWVICEPELSREGIESYLARHGPFPGLRFVYVSKTRQIRVLENLPGLFYIGYNMWQRRAYRAALRLHRRLQFDIVHQVNYCGYREPSYLFRLGAPFVWGPVGGTQNYPSRLLRRAGFVGGSREVVRSVLNRLTLRFSPRVRTAAREAAAMWGANQSIADDFQRVLRGDDVPVMLEVGAPPVVVPPSTGIRDTARPLRLLWAGDFYAFKALPLALDALLLLDGQIEWELMIAGDGPERDRWQRHAREIGIDDRISWLGWVPHEDMARLFKEADLFLFTSLRDTTGSVLLEALASQTPVIAPDHQGAADVVTETCGIKVPLASDDEVVEGYRRAIEELASDPNRLASLSRGAGQRALHYSWRRQGERMRDAYLAVLARQEEGVRCEFDVSPKF